METKDTFTFAYNAFEKVLLRAEGDPAKILAYGLAASVVFVASFVGHGIWQAIGQDE
jgi:hypothetical protein